MIAYKVLNQDGEYDVFETETSQTVFTTTDQAEAKSLCRHLNFGGAFDGNTPKFFMINTKKDEIIENNSLQSYNLL